MKLKRYVLYVAGAEIYKTLHEECAQGFINLGAKEGGGVPFLPCARLECEDKE